MIHHAPFGKYFSFVFSEFVYSLRVLPRSEGRFAIVTNVGCGTRWPVGVAARDFAADEQHRQDGEVEWFWRPDAGAKFAAMLAHRADDGG
ncbi:hypothetical protein ACQR1W_14960 [Bradyrhizobium sp. HKCCYLS1011]|uniref:hypothetical protein n=1 Tax=Bradyrhizobium sp. HKCCYLS1011 TaxID=3420733 RepID=UPI003EB9B52A